MAVPSQPYIRQNLKGKAQPVVVEEVRRVNDRLDVLNKFKTDTTNANYLPTSNAQGYISLAGVTGNIGGSALSAGASVTGTVVIPGASAAVAAGATILATPVTFPGSGFTWNHCYLSGTDTVTIEVLAVTAGTPVASTFNVKILK